MVVLRPVDESETVQKRMVPFGSNSTWDSVGEIIRSLKPRTRMFWSL